ncbi:MAG: DUF58 domain-containing protein [Verrucomicrobiota bacterium]
MAHSLERRFHETLFRIYQRSYRQHQRIRQSLTPAGWCFLAALGLCGLVGVDTGRTTAYQVFALLFSIMSFTVLSLLRTRGRVRVERTIPGSVSAGERLRYRLVLHNLGERPLQSLLVQERVHAPEPSLEEFLRRREPQEHRRNPFDRLFLYYRWRWHLRRRLPAHLPEIPVSEVPALGSQQVAMHLDATHRGILRLEGVEVWATDPLGLFKAKLRSESRPDSLLVLPRRHALRLSLQGARPREHSGGNSLAGQRGRSDEYAYLRDYQPGDSLRRIHWKSWARHGHPVVKEFEQAFFPKRALVLDTFLGAHQEGVLEAGVSVAASVAASLDRQDALLDSLFVGEQLHRFATGTGTPEIRKLLELLSGVEAALEDNREDLTRQVERHLRSLESCVLVLLHWSDLEETLVARLRREGIDVSVFHVGTSREGLPTAPWMRPLLAEEVLRQTRQALAA